MSYLQALIIGILQGLTEFLPISSSAHLKLAKTIMEIPDSEAQVFFDLVCHLGTLFALMIFFKQDILALFRQDRKKLLLLMAATLPLVPFYFLLKPLREYASQTHLLGFFLIFTSLLLFLAEKIRFKKEKSVGLKNDVQDVLWIGTMQSAALIPGISRSASTISCAHMLGWSAKDAVRFSFLLSIPTIIGGNALHLLKISSSALNSLPWSICLAGFFASLTFGLFTIRHAMKWLEQGKLRPFAWYCLGIGVTVSIYLNL